MATGGGPYDEVCELCRSLTTAEGAVVIILGGALGSGYSLTVPHDRISEIVPVLEEMLQTIMADIAADQGKRD